MNTASIAAEVLDGIEELERAFPERVRYEPDGEGGAFVTIEDLKLGERWNPASVALTFQLGFNYPAAPPYPYYLPGEATPPGALTPPLQRVRWRDQDVIQISLRHNTWDPNQDRVLGCVLQVRSWLQRL